MSLSLYAGIIEYFCIIVCNIRGYEQHYFYKGSFNMWREALIWIAFKLKMIIYVTRRVTFGQNAQMTSLSKMTLK